MEKGVFFLFWGKILMNLCLFVKMALIFDFMSPVSITSKQLEIKMQIRAFMNLGFSVGKKDCSKFDHNMKNFRRSKSGANVLKN